MSNKHNMFYNLEKSAIVTIIGVIFLFSFAVIITLIAPSYVDPSWTSPTSSYQVQMYEYADPNYYVSSASSGSSTLEYVQHLKESFTLLAFTETDTVRILAPKELEKYVTKKGDPTLKLTSKLLLLRKAKQMAEADSLLAKLQEDWEKSHPKWKEERLLKPDFEIMELYDPGKKEAFSVAAGDGTFENWVQHNYVILDEKQEQPWHTLNGVIFVENPVEYRVSPYSFADQNGWRYDPDGEPVKDVEHLTNHQLGFRSRHELIYIGEHIYAIEGCWYCHTDQTRTLIQDVVLNGSDSFPAPPSSANEYIYQKITFPGTRRIGPDMSRVGVKRPSRDWHKAHFWSPKTASQGSIMPAFRHFFDNDPRGTAKNATGIPNYRFEAIFQYLMTKGTRITPPTEAWWLGLDPVKTKEIIEGQRVVP